MQVDVPPSDAPLVVVGATLRGLGIAAAAIDSGVRRVLVVESHGRGVPRHLVETRPIDIHYGSRVEAVEKRPGGGLVVRTADTLTLAETVVLADAVVERGPTPPWAHAIETRLLGSASEVMDGSDVLVVGESEAVAETLRELVVRNVGVVACVDESALSGAAEDLVRRAERRRQATVLWHSTPSAAEMLEDGPMVYFDDRRTPDLQFDAIVVAQLAHATPEVETSVSDGVFDATVAFSHVAASRYPGLSVREPVVLPLDVEDLRNDAYNATLTSFDTAHSDLWRLRVRPDDGDTSHLPGQYATLGLGRWEPRIDGLRDERADQRSKLIRRSYSISSRIFDEFGYLVDDHRGDELELYVVLVPSSAERRTELTPRLALKQAGDRIYVGPKIAGRYTLEPVTEPTAKVIFLATGTGEAPHNAMITELLRKGHCGPIVSLVSVRRTADLAYLAEHRRLEERFPNYRYQPLPTREPDVKRRYIQDVIASGELEAILDGIGPNDTHVFVCGNPAMIGLPEWDGDRAVFPASTGVCELLATRGLQVDRRGQPGQVHFEEYW